MVKHTVIKANKDWTGNVGHRRLVYGVVPFIMACGLYFMWGMAHNLNDVLIAQFRRAFNLTIFQASLVQSAFYIAYLIMPLPAAMILNRLGFRYAVVLGLCIHALGAVLFWPAGSFHIYAAFLGALFIIACGLVLIETSGVAMIPSLGPEKTYDWRFNLAQAFNALGSISGIFVGRIFIFPDQELGVAERAALTPLQEAQYSALQAEAVRMPYLVIAMSLLLIAVAFCIVRFPKAVDVQQEKGRFKHEVIALMQSRRVVLGVLTQLLYVGAQITCWSFLILYVRSQIDGLTDQAASAFLIYGLVAFFIGRIITTVCLKWFSIDHICFIMGAGAVSLTLIAAFIGGTVGVWSLVGVGFMMSVMYPAIFSMGLRGHENLIRTGSGFMIMAIIGGAIITAITGRYADAFGVRLAYLVPCLCYAAVMGFALYSIMVPENQGGDK